MKESLYGWSPTDDRFEIFTVLYKADPVDRCGKYYRFDLPFWKPHSHYHYIDLEFDTGSIECFLVDICSD